MAALQHVNIFQQRRRIHHTRRPTHVTRVHTHKGKQTDKEAGQTKVRKKEEDCKEEGRTGWSRFYRPPCLMATDTDGGGGGGGGKGTSVCVLMCTTQRRTLQYREGERDLSRGGGGIKLIQPFAKPQHTHTHTHTKTKRQRERDCHASSFTP